MKINSITKFQLLSLFSFTLLFNTCTDKSGSLPTIVNELKPGEFSLARITNLGKRQWAGSSAVLFLDTVTNTKSYYFLLENKGDFNITGIKASLDNPFFRFSPDSIDTLQSHEKSSLLPVFKLTISHGNHPSGIGYTSVLDTGINACRLTITGTTHDRDGKKIDISLQVEVVVYAKLVDLNFYCGTNQIDLSSPDGNLLGNYPGIHDVSTMPVYSINGTDKIIVENICNTDVGISWWNSTNTEPRTLQLASGTRDTLPSVCTVEIDCRNVIALPEKFNQDPNGYIQFSFFNLP